MIPGPWTFALLALAAYRVWRLLAEDSITDKIRWRIYKATGSREWFIEFVSCPWCLGAWVAVAWWGAWWAWPHTVTIAAVPFALSAAVGSAAMLLNLIADED